MKNRWKILLTALAVVILSLGLTLLTLRVGPSSGLEAYKSTLRAQGEKLEISEVAPVPPLSGQNGRDAIEAAFSSLPNEINVPYTIWMIAPGKAMPGWTQSVVGSSEFTNSWDDFTSEIAGYAPAIDYLRQSAEFPKLDYGLNFQEGPALPLPHLAPYKRSAQLLAATIVCDLHNGQTGDAATNLCVMLHLVKANEDENIFISHLVRIAIATMASGSTWGILQTTNVTDAQLAAIQKSWESLQYAQAAERAMLMERAMTLATVTRARADGAYFDSLVGYSGGSFSGPGGWSDDLKQGIGKAMWRASWSYSEESGSLHIDQIVLQTLRTMHTNQFWKTNYDTMQAQLSKINLTYPGQAIVHRLEIPDFEEFVGHEFAPGAVRRTMMAETGRRVVITAVALKRFQLKHGQFPDSLSALCPEFLAAVPVDPMDGNPLRYRKNDDGTYLLYSVGEDGVDDGGDPSFSALGKAANNYWQNDRARDWVWPQPATIAEIQTFWATNSMK